MITRKKCRVCKRIQTKRFFSRAKKHRDGLASLCKTCHGSYAHEHYLKNKVKYLKRNKKAKLELRKKLYLLKSGPCTDCGKKYPPWVMDFDHRDPKKKYASVSVLANIVSPKRMEAEAKKCDLVCSNCHRQRTYGGKRNSKIWLGLHNSMVRVSGS